jgi:hypothetical protein
MERSTGFIQWRQKENNKADKLIYCSLMDGYRDKIM